MSYYRVKLDRDMSLEEVVKVCQEVTSQSQAGICSINHEQDGIFATVWVVDPSLVAMIAEKMGVLVTPHSVH